MTSAEPADQRRPTSLRWDAVILAVLLSFALLLSHRGSGFTVDEGSYAIQAHAIRDGSWEIHWPFRSLDPGARHFPYHGGAVTDTAEYAYASHPAWPAALSVVTRALPERVGLRALSLASVLVAALAAGALAKRLVGDGAARWAFWIAATSPVLADGLMVWAHAPAAAAGGVGVLAGVALWRREPPWWWPVLAVAVACGALLRSESVLFALALGGVVGLLGLVRRDGRAIAIGLVTGASGVGAFLAERAWIHHLTGREGLGRLAREGADEYGWLSGRLHGAGVSFIQDTASSTTAAACTVIAFLLVAGVVVVRRRPDRYALRPDLLLVGSAGLLLVRLVLADRAPVAGLLPAWPIVLLAALGVGRDRAPALAVAAGVAVFGVAVLLTQYDDGGGLQWGARFLSPAVVPLAALAGAGALAGLVTVRDRQAAALVLGATALLGLVITDHVREDNQRGMAQISALGEPVVLVHGDQLARLDWRAWPDRCWVADGGDLQGAVQLLARAGVTTAAYVGFDPADFAGAASATPDGPGSRIGTLRIAAASPPDGPTEHAFARCERPLA